MEFPTPPIDKRVSLLEKQLNNARLAFSSETSLLDLIDKIHIDEKDIKIDTYRSSGAGGQHVNKTDSAIRITHIPTGIIVQSQNDRSQHRNKDEAMSRLKSILYQHEMANKEKQAQSSQNKTLIEWGYQIRSYVLHPYQMVNDLRTEHKIGNALGVLEGDLDELMIKKLMQDKMNDNSYSDEREKDFSKDKRNSKNNEINIKLNSKNMMI